MELEFGAPVGGIRLHGVRAPETKSWGGPATTGRADAEYRRRLAELRGDRPDLKARLDAAKSELARAEACAVTPEDRAIVMKARADLLAIEQAAEHPAQLKAAIDGARERALCEAHMAAKAAEAQRKASTPEAIQAGHLARVRHELQTGRCW